MTGTEVEAQQFSATIRSAIETKVLNDLPVVKITVHQLVGHDVKLSVLTNQTLSPEKDLSLKVGRIEFEGFSQSGIKVRRTSLTYGMNK